MKRFFLKSVLFSIILTIFVFICGCNDNTINSASTIYDANTINGTITFVDTNLVLDTTYGYYNVSAFAYWPPTANATASSRIYPTKVNGKYTANYKIIIPSDGSYTLTSAYIKIPYIVGSSVLGLGMYDMTQGNDTTHNLSIIYGQHAKAVISGRTGIGNINFNSWLDTTKKIYTF